MTREDIIRMAREAGISDSHASGMFDFLERFAALVAAAERQNICKHIAMLHDSLVLASDQGRLKMRGSK